MSCPTALNHQYFDPTVGFGCATSNPMLNYYYSPGPEYIQQQEHEVNGQELIYFEDVTQYSVNHFLSYNNDDESDSLDSSYNTEIDYQYSDCSLMIDESPMSEMNLSVEPAQNTANFQQHPHPDQISMQIQRNEELARLLSPIRKSQEQMQNQQTRKNAENARRKFSLTNGIRPKQRQLSLTSSSLNKPAKLSVSVRKWQSEILSKLPLQQQCRQRNAAAPNVNVPSEWQKIAQRNNYSRRPPVPPQRRASLQVVPEWKQEEEDEEEIYYCSSR